MDEQNNLRLQTVTDEAPADVVSSAQAMPAKAGANDLTPTALKKPNSPNMIDENQLQLKPTHSRQLTVTQGKVDPEQVPSSPIKKFFFAEKMKTSAFQKSKSELQESDGQEENKRLLLGNDVNGKPIRLQPMLKKSKSSFD